jgi:3-isopropylmalate/(R)-2-methylmalate dehydratase small subunit
MNLPLGGRVVCLDRDDINTDEIIPARYLTEITREALGPHLLEDLDLPGFRAADALQGAGAILTRANFGCGSSREHAPWALEANGIRVVIAASFARIFRQNMFNCGMLAVELPPETLAGLFARFSSRATTVAVDLESSRLHFAADGSAQTVPFTLTEFDRSLVRAGGWVAFADARY